jgi:DNA-binding transcriptional LysR family regulator
MNLFQIEYFNSVARYLNFTAAAKSLFVTQPSLSKQIALLEKELGVRLIHRNRRSVRLTPAGIVFLKEFEIINNRISLALEKVRLADRGSIGNISIGCLETINVDMFFPELINNFTSTYPEIKITVERGGFKYLREKIQEGIFDIIFTLSLDIQNSPELLIKNIHKRKGCIVMSAKNKLAHRKSVPYSELSREPLVIFSQDESPGVYSNALKTAKYHGFNNIRQVHNVETLLSYLDLGLGFSLLDRTIGEYRKNKLKFYDLPENEATFYAVCACKKDNINPTVHLLLNMIP